MGRKPQDLVQDEVMDDIGYLVVLYAASRVGAQVYSTSKEEFQTMINNPLSLLAWRHPTKASKDLYREWNKLYTKVMNPYFKKRTETGRRGGSSRSKVRDFRRALPPMEM